MLVSSDHLNISQRIIQEYELDAMVEYHPALAMAELCLLTKELKNKQAWKDNREMANLIIIHPHTFAGADEMCRAVRKHLPEVNIIELKNGKLALTTPHEHALDVLEEPPIIVSDTIDANELNMLLDIPISREDEQ